MSVQIVSLSAFGVALGMSTTDATVMDDGSLHTFEKPGIYDLGLNHSVSVMHTGRDTINHLPADLVLRDWIRSLDEPLSRIEDYVADFVAHLETADLRMFQSDGEASWKGRSLVWLLNSAGYEIVADLLNKNDDLRGLSDDIEKRCDEAHLQAMHDLTLKYLDLEIAARYSESEYYTAFPLSEAVEFFKNDLEEKGYEKSLIALLGGGFEDLLTDFSDEDFQNRLTLSLSDDFVLSLVDLASLMICTRTPNAEQGAVLTFCGYGSEQAMPAASTIVVDGVFIAPLYYSANLGDHSKWVGLPEFEKDPGNHPSPDAEMGIYPFWVSTPSANVPLVTFQNGGTGILYSWIDGYSASYLEHRRKDLRDLSRKFRDENPEVDGIWSAKISLAAEPGHDWDSMNLHFNSLSSKISLKAQSQIVESLVRLETFGSLVDRTDSPWPSLGGPIEVAIIKLGEQLEWITRS
jgi:hypothetical protein